MTETSPNPTERSTSVFKSPLLHFMVLGVLVFLLYSFFASRQPRESEEIVVSAQQIELLASMWQKQWRRPPTQQELDGLIQSYIREEVLYRQALSMGLDRDDTVIRRRLAQKIEFLAQDLAAQVEPTDQELRNYFVENPEKFEVPPRITFQHVYINLDQRGDSAETEAELILSELRAGGDPRQLGDRFLL